MSISVCITTYGEDSWRDLAYSRALPSVLDQGADEIVVKHWPDMTIGPARNATAEEATSDFLIHLDADDELEAGYIDAMRAALAKTPAPSLTLFQPAVRYIRNGRAAPDLMRPIGDLRHDNFLVVGTMISRARFLKVGGFSDYPHGYEDYSVWAKAWKSGAIVTQVPAAVYVAYINPKSAHRTMWRNRREQQAMHQKVQAELFPEGA